MGCGEMTFPLIRSVNYREMVVVGWDYGMMVWWMEEASGVVWYVSVCGLILCGGRFLCCFRPLDCLGGRSENLWFVAPKPKKDKEKKYEGNK